jgi:hypothetical protein
MYTGVVENINDPLKLGRVQARYFSVHTGKKSNGIDYGIPTADLPWSVVASPTTSASVNGIGDSPTGILNGTWVIAYFRGDELQNPVIIGTLVGVPSEVADPEYGFNDPDGVYPKEDFIGESDVNRLARNESIGSTIVKVKIDGIEVDIEKADGSTWSEPITPYNAVYPHNKVNESKSGHITEIDDTPNAERLHEYHKAGTFSEIHPDGSKVLKIVGKAYTIILDDNHIYIQGDSSETITGEKSIKAENLNINISTNATITIPTTDWQGNINLEGNVIVTGNITASGEVKASTVVGTTEVTAKEGGVKVGLSSHTHGGGNVPKPDPNS